MSMSSELPDEMSISSQDMNEEIFMSSQSEELSQAMSVQSESKELPEEIFMSSQSQDMEITITNEIKVPEISILRKTEPEDEDPIEELQNDFAMFPHAFGDAEEVTLLPSCSSQPDMEVESVVPCKRIKLSPSCNGQTELLFQMAIKSARIKLNREKNDLPVGKAIIGIKTNEKPLINNPTQMSMNLSTEVLASNSQSIMLTDENVQKRTGTNSSEELNQILEDLEYLGLEALAKPMASNSDDEDFSCVYPNYSQAGAASAELWNEILDADNFFEFYQKWKASRQ